MAITHGGSDAALPAGQSAACAVRERPDGFTLAMVRCLPVRVRRRATHFEVESQRGRLRKVGLTARQLRTAIMHGLMSSWRLPSGRRPPRSGPLRRWVTAQVRRLLTAPVTAQYDRLLQGVDPNAPAVHRALSAVASTRSTLAMCPGLYRHPHLVSDIITYRAAAIVATNFADLVHCARQNHADSAPGLGVSATDANTPLREWRNLLSPSGRSYRSLDRTLMNLPRGVPGGLVCRLSEITLPRPLTDPLELRLVTLFLDRVQQNSFLYRDRDPGRRHQQVFVTARPPQIREALRRVAAHTRNDLRVTRHRHLRFLVRFLLDFPGQHAGTIVGLADKAIRWHQQQLVQERVRILERHGATTRLGMPPIPVPADSSVQHLETVTDIVDEGERMGHCVAAYVPQALRGVCYLFHIEHAGDAATVMVADGRVVEAQGPRNHSNEASRWGAIRLGTWARGLPRADIPQVG